MGMFSWCKSDMPDMLDLGCHLDNTQQPVTDAERAEMVDFPYRSAIGSLTKMKLCFLP